MTEKVLQSYFIKLVKRTQPNSCIFLTNCPDVIENINLSS